MRSARVTPPTMRPALSRPMRRLAPPVSDMAATDVEGVRTCSSYKRGGPRNWMTGYQRQAARMNDAAG